jgi:ABC-type dipeptide/oligopeptide/nickel transport system ATPase subunit
MAATALPALPGRCLERVSSLLADGRRKLLGLVGPPGAGKSTLGSFAVMLGVQA